ncbi:hypothetical protein MVEN_00110800 [Mycena venus]|uniref:HAM1-like N-terminal domain-containing protein n=1 Tax=Mycena venus TaxID=2733690 RepID=A0A8H7DFI8_9AGAR|nr:hypothetical protein MVEN_00110800 [Mycena venus]
MAFAHQCPECIAGEEQGRDPPTFYVVDPLRRRGRRKGKRDAQEAAHHLRTLVSLVLTNAEMRKLITHAGTVGCDLLA